MKISSPAFENFAAIPKEYTGEGEDQSPPLVFEAIPSHAKSLALFVEDPDAPMGIFIHWILFDLPPETLSLNQNISSTESLSKKIKQGRNDFGKIGYGGPMPPSGRHRYFFRLYALDTPLNLKEGVSKEDFKKAIEAHVLTEAELVGTYQKSGKKKKKIAAQPEVEEASRESFPASDPPSWTTGKSAAS